MIYRWCSSVFCRFVLIGSVAQSSATSSLVKTEEFYAIEDERKFNPSSISQDIEAEADELYTFQ